MCITLNFRKRSDDVETTNNWETMWMCHSVSKNQCEQLD